jgi:transcriptional regulator with XRE-family HTH domain
MDIKIQFGLKVKQLRNEKGWSQEALAHKADIDRTYLPGIESGKRNVSIVVIEKLAKALKVDLTEIMNFKKTIK